MIERKERYVHEFHVRGYLEQRGLDIKKLSGEDLMVELFGDSQNKHRFRIIDPMFGPKTKWYHRLNRFWAFPIFFVMAPFQYLIYGRTGFSDETLFGYWMLKVTGYR